MPDELAAFLSASPVFAAVPRREIQALVAVAREQRYAAREYVFEEGDPAAWFCVVRTGRVRIFRHSRSGKDVVLELLGPGEPFGGVAVIERRPYPASAQATEPSVVVRIPQEPTIHQRFGIVLHQVLERYHGQKGEHRSAARTGRIAHGGSLDSLMELFHVSWRRAGFGDSDDELQFRERAVQALRSYWERDRESGSEAVWFERSFAFKIGPHLLRGRVDRVDRHPDGTFELIDYKTGRAKTEQELREDVQLSVYQMGARESWGIETSAQSYFYVLTGEKVPVAHSEEELERVRSTVTEIAAGILKQRFEPTPSPDVCRFCDYRIICPAAEK